MLTKKKEVVEKKVAVNPMAPTKVKLAKLIKAPFELLWEKLEFHKQYFDLDNVNAQDVSPYSSLLKDNPNVAELVKSIEREIRFELTITELNNATVYMLIDDMSEKNLKKILALKREEEAHFKRTHKRINLIKDAVFLTPTP